MSETIYQIEFQTKTEIGFKDHYETTFAWDFLPRVGDMIAIDGYYHKVLCVEYDYKHKIEPTVYIESIGDYVEYTEKYLANL
ncbi:hypothetical protein [Vibrio diabolicus]|uniref:hypothetical protein n=1 Tax=Vibrio diabolicus TaxID=50719 RepID=UPI0015F6C9B8|nr:hypothetical protein [Vibrio diabolicus]